jgi:hypothetical protein
VLPTHLLPFDFPDLATLLKIANPPIAKKQLHHIHFEGLEAKKDWIVFGIFYILVPNHESNDEHDCKYAEPHQPSNIFTNV